MQRLGVIGAGESGVGAALLAKENGYDVLVSDYGSIRQSYKEELIKNNIRFEEGGHDFEWLLNADLLVKSPGVPDTVKIIQEAKSIKMPVESEIEFGYKFCRSKIIGITGSNGKTTTTLLTYHILKTAGIACDVGGNLGKSFCRILSERNDQKWIILELSSFQLDDIHGFKPDIAVLLNITADHLDRYDYKIENYIQAKFRIFENQDKDDLLIYNAVDPKIKAHLTRDFKTKTTPLFNDYFFNDQLKTINGHTFETKRFNLKGKHNMFNAICAIEVALETGADIDLIQKGLNTFENHPHRLEHVARIDGIDYINDSKATNVDATCYALDAFPGKIIWIAGGTDKGNDYTPILELVKSKVSALICLGKDNQKLKTVFENILDNIQEVDNTDDAVTSARALAEESVTVLLSPACASFDLFRNYEDRGNQFKNSVWKLIDK